MSAMAVYGPCTLAPPVSSLSDECLQEISVHEMHYVAK